MDDLTIVIQGRVLPECLEFYAKEYNNNKVIISTWEDIDLDENYITPNMFVIKSTKPEIHGRDNIFLQVTSTNNGLELVQTPYCIKMRGDEMYSNIPYILDTIKTNNKIIWTSPIYFRHWLDAEYHISDHLICGTTSNLKNMFGNYERLSEVAEVSICLNYFKNLGIDYKQYNSTDLMVKYFDILDLEQLEPYMITSNSQSVKRHTKFIPEYHLSISKIEMLYNDKVTQNKIFNGN